MALIKFRRGTASQWTSANPILAAGEPGYETNTKKFKIGDGSANWATLPYFVDSTGVVALITDYLETLDAPPGFIELDVDEEVPVGTATGAYILRKQV